MKALSNEKISCFALVLLITGAIDSIRNLPGTALFGTSLIFFFLFSAMLFLIPVALVSAELSSAWSEDEGGIYSWVQHAFGPNWAFLAIWLQWINTMVWYPTILSFIAGALAYLINPELIHHKFFLLPVIILTFWALTFLGLSGIRISATVASFCTLFGVILPMLLMIGLAIVWLFTAQPLAIHFTFNNLLPDWKNSQSWISLTAIMTSFLGMELAAVHVRNVRNPQKNFPRAMLFSTLLIMSTMIFGSLAIAFVLPKEQISLVGGVMQAFENFFDIYHLHPIMPLMIVLLLLGSLGGMINWIISPAKGLLLAADHGFLPVWLHKLNKHGVASRILWIQAILVTLLCGTFLLLPSINAIYWFFQDLSTELYMLMYVLMFCAACQLKRKFPQRKRPFQIPGGNKIYYFVCVIGLIGCALTLVIGFIPPDSSVGVIRHYPMYFIAGLILMIVPTGIFYRYKKIYRNE